MWHCFTITENLTSHLTAFLWSSISFFKSPWFTTHTSFWLNCKDPKENTTHFLTHFYVQASISAEPNRMKRMCLVHWLTNESLMGIIFAANNCTHTLFGFHTLNLNKRKAVSHTSPGLFQCTVIHHTEYYDTRSFAYLMLMWCLFTVMSTCNWILINYTRNGLLVEKFLFKVFMSIANSVCFFGSEMFIISREALN